jgi:hypothetical protein
MEETKMNPNRVSASILGYNLRHYTDKNGEKSSLMKESGCLLEMQRKCKENRVRTTAISDKHELEIKEAK